MRIFFSVGEPSGDQHAAGLIRELRNRDASFEFSGFGGPLMEQAGCQLDFRLTDLAVMGLFRVLPMLRQFYRLIRHAEQLLREQRPDAVVLVDFPGFNWWIAHKAKKLGIQVLYFLPPQLWAWGPWRIRRVRKNVDHVLSGLNFEQRWYEEHGVAAEYVGHPFYDEVSEHVLDQELLSQWRGDFKRIVGLLPGSRNHEVTQNWPIMVEAVRQLAEKHPDTGFVVACFKERHREFCRQVLSESECDAPVQFVLGKTPEVIEAADCCLMVSGSVSLEMLARTTPAVVFYYIPWLTGLVWRPLITCPFGSLPNMMADRIILPEYYPQGDGLQGAKEVADRLSLWLTNERSLNAVRCELETLRSEVVRPGAIARTADAILRRLKPSQLERAA